MQGERPALGAHVQHGPTTCFALFSAQAKQCAVRLFRDPDTRLKDVPMDALGDGYHEAVLEDVGHGALYKFVLDGVERPDPYARFLPFGVHGPAMVFESRYTFRNPRPPRPRAPVLYELHVGAFTQAGTFAAACLKLPDLKELGVTTIELMPVAAFAGARGWGYDGVALFAPFAPYGTPDELRALVDTAHGLGLGVLLDVVYNHFGPDGNYLPVYSPDYFSRGASAWGDGPNFAFEPMRELARANVRYWMQEFRFDGLRFDAVHAITDASERHIVRELVEVARHVLPSALLFAEDDRNDPALVREFGFDGVWADDFHHQLHVTLSGERDGYYAAYQPGLADLARCIERGWLYEGQASFLSRLAPRGKPATGLSAGALVYCLQNHDQVGNRALGDRASHALSREAYALASSLLLFLPMTPLLFMGQEWACSTPFQYFTDHHAELGAMVSKGRREEFKDFHAFCDDHARALIPDPQAEATFQASKLNWEERARPEHAKVRELYKALLALRRDDAVMQGAGREQLQVSVRGDVLEVRRTLGTEARVWLGNFGRCTALRACPRGARVLLGSCSKSGDLDALGFAILQTEVRLP